MKGGNGSGDDGSGNLVRYYEINRCMDLHERRLKSIKPTIQLHRIHTHQSTKHIRRRPLAELNRIIEINMQNRALLKKIEYRSVSKVKQEKPYKLVKNNRQKNWEEYRQRVENLGIVRRIKEAKSRYESKQFEGERKVTENYLNTISKYGYRDLVPNKTIIHPILRRPVSMAEKYEGRSQHLAHSRGEIRKKEIDQEEPNTIIGMNKLKWSSDGLNAEITYIIWQKNVTIQIDMSSGECAKVQISREMFNQVFHDQVDNVQKCIKYHEGKQGFYLDLGETGRKMNREGGRDWSTGD